MQLFPKVNRTQIFPPQKCSGSSVGGMLDRKCVHVQYIGGKFNYEKLRWRPDNQINQGRFFTSLNIFVFYL